MNDEEENEQKCPQGNRIHLLQQISDWTQDLDDPNLILIIGASGIGKRTVTRTTVDKFERRNQVGVWEGEGEYVGCGERCRLNNCIQSCDI